MDKFNINKSLLYKIIKLLIIGFVIVFAIFFIIRYITTGTLIIITNDKDSMVKIYPVSQPKKTRYVSIKDNKYIKKLGTGEYNIVVYNKEAEIKQVVKIKSRKSHTLNANLTKEYYLQNVTPNPLNFITANKNNIMYIGSDTGLLKTISSNAKIETVNDKISFKEIQWYKYNDGVGLTSEGKLYKIPEFKEIPTPSLNESINYVSYSIADNNNVFYSDGKKIYNLSDGKINKIYEDNKERINILNNRRQLSFTKTVGLNQFKQRYETMTYVQNKDTGMTSKKVDGYELSWSPDGKTLVSSGDDGPVTLYDQYLNIKNTGVDGNVYGVKWLDNNIFLYSNSNQLYSYNIQNKISKKISEIPGTGSISAIYPSPESDYIYIVSQKDQTGVSLLTYKIGLNNQKNDSESLLLSLFLPITHYNCYITYMNVNTYTIVINQLTRTSNCKDSAGKEFQNLGFDINKYNVVVTNQ